MLARAHSQMSTGTMISGAGHLAIILWVVLGGTLFRTDRDPLPVTTNVTLISQAAFEGREATRPEVITQAPDAPQPAPAATEVAPDPVQQRPAEAPPPARPEPQPAPEAPAAAPSAPEAPPPPPAERVAPVPVPQAPEDVQVAEEQQEAATPDGAGAEAAEPQEATAPEAASTRIITEATETAPDSTSEEIALAPVATPRPRSRPAPSERAVDAPTQTPAQIPPSEPTPPEADPLASAVASAVAEASQVPPAADPALPVGPPLTSSEREGLRVAVQQCWNIGSLSSEAMRTTVTVAVEMEQDGRPVTGSIRMINVEGGSDAAARQAFEAARRAIIRCGARGFDLPVEKYAQWRDIEMTFNPERMRIR